MEIRVPIAYYGVKDRLNHYFTRDCFEDLINMNTIASELRVYKNYNYSELPIGLVTKLEIDDNSLMATIIVYSSDYVDYILKDYKHSMGFTAKKSYVGKDVTVFDRIELKDIGLIDKQEDVY